MKRIHQKLAVLSALTLTTTVTTFSTPQPANAQLVELAAGAISSIFNRPPRPLPNQSYSFGTGNLNSNTFNLCLFPCLPTPNSIPSPVRFPVPTAAAPIAPSPIGAPVPTNGSFSSSTVQNQTGTVPPGFIPPTAVRPGYPVPPQVAPQPVAPRPVLVMPPIKLPINLPL
jgi:hypothetical protein